MSPPSGMGHTTIHHAYDALTSWQEWLSYEKRASPATLRAYLHDVSLALGFFSQHFGGDLPLSALGKLTLADFRSWLAHETARAEHTARLQPTIRHTTDGQARSRARRVSALRAFFRYIEKEFGIKNPALTLLKSPRLKPRLPRPLSVQLAQQAPSDIAGLHIMPALAYVMKPSLPYSMVQVCVLAKPSPSLSGRSIILTMISFSSPVKAAKSVLCHSSPP